MRKIIFLFFSVIALANCSDLISQIKKEKMLNLLTDSVYSCPTGLYEKVVTQTKPYENNPNFKNKQFEYNCNTSFWTIDTQGNIRQWDLNTNSISGGDTVLNGGSKGGLAFCGISPTFYCANSPNTGISYYDSTSGWLTISTPVEVLNNGGFNNDQYYMGIVGSYTKVLYYFDGINIITIDSLTTEYFPVCDIAVDSLGRAWVFTGSSMQTATNLNVYNNSGQISSYNINFTHLGAYGSFFLNNILYVGIYDSIYPIIINGNIAQLGTAVPFFYQNFCDLASCGKSNLFDSLIEQTKGKKINIYPSPTNGNLTIETHKNATIEIFNIEGQLTKKISAIDNQTIIDISDFAKGMYFINVTTDKEIITKKFIKQ